MNHLSMDYRLSLYTELVELLENKIYIVQSSLDNKLYIKKILYPENYDVFIKLKDISSPYIPKIYEILSFEYSLIIIEEYINGSTLDEILTKQKALSENSVIEYTIELCNVLDVLHNCEPPIIHRDIKPSNIIINNANSLKLIDFDVSRTHKDNISTDTEVLGTHGYAAPEQFGFSQTDARTDIYSLGITMNVMLTGEFPITKLYKGNLSNIITKCTKFDPDKRFQNVKELKQAILKKSITHKSKSSTLTYTSNRLPGFRSGKISFGILGFFWYGFLVLTSFGFFTDDLTPKSRAEDIIITSFLFIITLLFGNYKNLKARLPLLSSKRLIVQLIGYGIYLFLMLFIVGILLPS